MAVYRSTQSPPGSLPFPLHSVPAKILILEDRSEMFFLHLAECQSRGLQLHQGQRTLFTGLGCLEGPFGKVSVDSHAPGHNARGSWSQLLIFNSQAAKNWESNLSGPHSDSAGTDYRGLLIMRKPTKPPPYPDLTPSWGELSEDFNSLDPPGICPPGPGIS